MTEIHVLPNRPFGLDHITRLHADLTQALESGTDLGSRAPHIRADGDRLMALAEALERAVKLLLQELAHLGLLEGHPDTGAALRKLIDDTAELARNAQRFPAAE